MNLYIRVCIKNTWMLRGNCLQLVINSTLRELIAKYLHTKSLKCEEFINFIYKFVLPSKTAARVYLTRCGPVSWMAIHFSIGQYAEK